MLSPYLLLVLPMMVPFCIRAFPTTQIDETKPEQNENFPRPNIQDPPPTLVEGDIVKNEQTTIQVRMSVADRQMTWTGRQIPYIFNQGDYNSAEKMIIRNALKELQRLVSNCVQFYETPTPRKDYIVIKNSHGCYSSVGRIGGAQTVSLSTDGCLNRQGTIFHEMMHALGFWHEHNRPDRDSHIAINYANIDRNHWLDFDKLKDEEVDTLSQPYDLTSVMHYNQWTFSKFPNDRNKTSFSLLDKVSDRSLIGQRSNLSAIDINKIKTLYKCGIKQCSYPGSLENGMINELHYMEESPVGTWISYNCIQGFVLIGPSRRMCKYNGTWTGFKPECVNSNQGIIKYCSFEQDMCGWRQDSNDDFDWTRTNKRTETEMTGPTVDNTYEGSGGYFIYMESSSPKTVGYKTRLISPDIVPKYTNHTIKVKLFYHMFGDTMGTLNIYLNITTHMGEKQETLASLKKAEGNVWHMKEFSYNSTYHTSNDKVVKYNIILEGVVGPGYHSDIGIDDIIVREVQMTEMQVKVLQLPVVHACAFHATLCGWTQSLMDESDWVFCSLYTSTNAVSTSIMMQQSKDQLDQNQAHRSRSCPRFSALLPLLISAVCGRRAEYLGLESNLSYKTITLFDKAGPVVCAEFHYRKYGPDVGKLRMDILTSHSKYQIWSQIKDKGQEWFKDSVEFQVDGLFQLEFTGIRGYGFYGEIAINDITVTSGNCKTDLSCNFEHDSCNWANDNDDDCDWIKRRGPTPTPDTGPDADHTTLQGYYMYIESSAPRRQGDRAHLVSSAISTTNPGCLTFWYHMRGTHIAHLRVYKISSSGHSNYAWKLYGQQGTQWHQATVPFASDRSFKIVIEGEVGSSFQGDIAIDDIDFSYLPCK